MSCKSWFILTLAGFLKPGRLNKHGFKLPRFNAVLLYLSIFNLIQLGLPNYQGKNVKFGGFLVHFIIINTQQTKVFTTLKRFSNFIC